VTGRYVVQIAFCFVGLPVLASEIYRGWRTGQTGPLVDRFFKTYQKADQPIGYWLSMSCNAFLAVFMAVALPMLVASSFE